MRVFDIYSFNVIDKVKFKDTQKYVEKMLSEFGLRYKNIGFSLENPLRLEAVVEKYPTLSKYLVSVGENIQRRQSFFTSFTKNWIDGEIYADKEDYAVIGEIFTKIPRPFNFGSSTLILDGIDWYGGGNLSPATKNDAFYVGKVPTGRLPFMNNSIMLVREIDYGNKFNIVYVTVEATGEPAPRNTTDILEKLKTYLGEPLKTERKCMFSHEEYDRFTKLQVTYRNRLEELFQSMLKETTRWEMPDEPLIQKIADKKTLTAAFKGTGFAFGERKDLLPGMNRLICKDSHNYIYEIWFSRELWLNRFVFNLFVSGYNFKLALNQKTFDIIAENQSAGIIAKIVEYCIAVRDIVGTELSADFGDTPEWY